MENEFEIEEHEANEIGRVFPIFEFMVHIMVIIHKINDNSPVSVYNSH